MSDGFLPGLVHRTNQPAFLKFHRTLERKSLAQVTTVDAGFPVAERNPYCNQLAGQVV